MDKSIGKHDEIGDTTTASSERSTFEISQSLPRDNEALRPQPLLAVVERGPMSIGDSELGYQVFECRGSTAIAAYDPASLFSGKTGEEDTGVVGWSLVAA